MSKQLTYLLITLFLLSCCKRHVVEDPVALIDAQIINADSILQLSPGSALEYLMSSRDSLEAKSLINTHYHALLTSEAFFKTDNPQYFPDELHSAMLFFDSLALLYPGNKSLPLLSARSHYMEGIVLLEDDNPIGACKEYLNTLKIMEEAYDEKDMVGYKAKFMGLTHTRLGGLFSSYSAKKASLEMYKTAVKYFRKVDGFCIANPIRSLAWAFQFDYQNDSAVYYYRKAIDLAKKHNKQSVIGKSLAQLATIYYDMGKKDSAFIMVRTALSLPSSVDEHLTQLYILGTLFAQECIYDSAIFYLKQGIVRNSCTTTIVSAENLMKCYEALGDTVQMQYYKNIYGDKLDEHRYYLAQEHEIENIYEQYKQDKLQKEHIAITRKRIIIIVSITLLIAVTIFLFRKKIIMVWRKAHDNADGDSTDNAPASHEVKASNFMDEPICRYILQTAEKQRFKSRIPYFQYAEYALSRDELLTLEEAMDEHYDDFSQWIRKDFPKLTAEDITYCCLFTLGLSVADISVFMQRSYPTINERSRKLKRIFNSNDTLKNTIINIINSHNEPQQPSLHHCVTTD